MSETEIQSAIIDTLTGLGYIVHRCNNGAVYSKKAQCFRKPGRGYIKGWPDLEVISDFRVVFVEVKDVGKKQAPAQKKIQEALEVLGFKYICVSSIAEVLAYFKSAKNATTAHAQRLIQEANDAK